MRSGGSRRRRGDRPKRPPREEGQDGAGAAGLVAVIEVIGAGIVEVDGLLDEAQAEIPRVEAEIADGIAGDRSDMVQSRHCRPPDSGSGLALAENIVPLWIGDNPCKYDGYVYDLETIAGAGPWIRSPASGPS